MADSADRIGIIQAQVHDLIAKYRLAIGEPQQDRSMRELQQQVKNLRSENEELRLLQSFTGDAAARADLAKRLQAWSREINQAIAKIQP